MHALCCCCSTFPRCWIYAHHSPNSQDIILMSLCHRSNPSKPCALCPKSTELETKIASSCLSPCLSRQYLPPSLISGSGIIRLFATATCMPLDLARCDQPKNRLRLYSAGVHLPAATLAPIRPTTPKALLYRCHIRYPSQLCNKYEIIRGEIRKST